MTTCEHCGAELVGKRQDARHCDSTCRARASEQTLKGAQKPLTQRDRILFELGNAGERGVHSEVFYRLRMPRFPARILELKAAGHNITSVPEGNGARYVLHPSPRSSSEEQRSSNPQAPGSNPGGGTQARGVTSTINKSSTPAKANPQPADIGAADREVPGGESGVPAAPEDLQLFGESSYERLRDKAA